MLDILLRLCIVERLGAVGDSDVELGGRDVLSVVVVDHVGVDGESARIDVDTPEIETVDMVDGGADIRGRRAHRRDDDVGEV